MPKRVLSLSLMLLAAGCDAPTEPAPNAGVVTSTASAAGTPTSAASREVLIPAKPKETKDAAVIGTLPDGVGIAVGEKAPDFEAPDQDGKPVLLSKLLERSRVMLVFYRGGW
jgi:hypothetical protein